MSCNENGNTIKSNVLILTEQINAYVPNAHSRKEESNIITYTYIIVARGTMDYIELH